jgi:hypothetical protein
VEGAEGLLQDFHFAPNQRHSEPQALQLMVQVHWEVVEEAEAVARLTWAVQLVRMELALEMAAAGVLMAVHCLRMVVVVMVQRVPMRQKVYDLLEEEVVVSFRSAAVALKASLEYLEQILRSQISDYFSVLLLMVVGQGRQTEVVAEAVLPLAEVEEPQGCYSWQPFSTQSPDLSRTCSPLPCSFLIVACLPQKVPRAVVQRPSPPRLILPHSFDRCWREHGCQYQEVLDQEQEVPLQPVVQMTKYSICL